MYYEIDAEYISRLFVILDDIKELRGSREAPSRYSLQYLFGYLEALRPNSNEV